MGKGLPGQGSCVRAGEKPQRGSPSPSAGCGHGPLLQETRKLIIKQIGNEETDTENLS